MVTKYYKTQMFLEDNGIKPERTDMRYGFNKVRSHQPRFETWEHFMSKAGLLKLILDQGDTGFTEYQYPNTKVADVLQLKGFKELVVYQVENKKPTVQEFPNSSCMVVDLRKMSKEVKNSFEVLRKYLREFVV